MALSAILIDGSMLEGGGQILRNSVALSVLMGTPVTVNKIRAGRSQPGLRPQHLHGIQLVSSIARGKLVGANVGSTEISLYPTEIYGGSYSADTKTAGSICLLAQAALPCLLYGDGPSQISLRGGTNADMAPPIDHTIMVLQPMAAKFGMNFQTHVKRRGYYPKGGGVVEIEVQPCQYLTAVQMVDFGQVSSITGRSYVAGNLPPKIAHIMSNTAKDLISREFRGIPVNIEIIKEPPHMGTGTASGIILVAETTTGCILGGSALGKRGLQAEDVGAEAAQALLTDISYKACVDEHLQDQLIVLMALAKGHSEIKSGPITLHTETAIAVASKLTEVL